MSYETNAVKSTGTVNTNSTGANPLTELVKQKGKDKVVYHDPEGYVAGREVEHVREAMRKGDDENAGWEEIFEAFDEEVSKGADLREAAREVRKSFNTGDTSLPVFVMDNLYISDSKVTPLADMMPRVAVDETTIKTDEVTEVGSAGTFSEGGTIPENDDQTNQLSYEVYDVGRKNEVSDKIQIARPDLSPVSQQQELQVESIRRYEESQIIQGSNHDTSGWDGFADLAPSANVTDESGNSVSASLSDVRDLITQLREGGAFYADMVMVTDFQSFRNIKEDIESQGGRFDLDGGNELSYGYTALEIDGVQIFESHGVGQTDGSRALWAYDASAHYMGVLADITLKPLSPTDTGVQFATYVHEVLVSRSPDRIAGITGLVA